MRRTIIPKRVAGFVGVGMLLALSGLASFPPVVASVLQPTISVTPQQATNVVGTQHTVTAHLSQDGMALPGRAVVFQTSGANSTSGQGTTDQEGNSSFTYTGHNTGTDTITVFGDLNENGMQDAGEPSATATKTWHDPKDPRTADWPKLTEAEMRSVQDLIAARKRTEALAQLVDIMKKYCCTFHTMQGGGPIYSPGLTDADGATQRKKGGRVRLGPGAYRSVAFLYSTLKHEMVHSSQWQDEAAAGSTDRNTLEIEAHQREANQSGNTGLSEAELNTVKARIRQYQLGFRGPCGAGASVAPVAERCRGRISRFGGSARNGAGAGPGSGLRFAISVSRARFASGSRIPLSMTLDNTGTVPLVVNRRFLVNHPAAPPEFREVKVEIIMPGGTRAPLDWHMTAGFPGRKDFRDLRPGDSVTRRADLADLFDLTEEGRYRVRARYRNVHPGPGVSLADGRFRVKGIGAARVGRTSNSTWFRIV